MKALSDLDYDQLLERAREAARLPDLADVDAQLRVDVHPLSEGGKHFWTKDPKGLAKWATHAHPWTALYHHILKWEGMTPAYAKRIAGEWYYEVFGHGPTAEHGGKLKAGHRSADDDWDYAGLDVIDAGVRSGYGDIAVTSDAWLRERANAVLRGLPPAPRPVDALRKLTDDEREIVLFEALREIDLEWRHLRAFDPSKHKRWLKPHPQAGKFRPMIDLLKAAIAAFDPKKDKHPFVLFTRPQLLKAARDRGIKLNRGESEDSIAAKLHADLVGSTVTPAPVVVSSVSGVTTKPGAKWPTGDATTEVELNGEQLGIVVHSSKTGGFFPFIPGGSKKTPLGNLVRVQPGAGSGYQTEQSAVDAIVRAHTPAKVSGPGLAGLKLTELRIESQVGGWNGKMRAKASHEISESGTPIGIVSEWGGYFSADLPSGGKAQGTHGYTMKTKSEAIQALVAAMPNSPRQGKTASAAVPTPTPTPSAASHGPEVQAALDVLYGKDPKANTAARQLVVYGALRRNHFDQLDPVERSRLLGDLSYILTTSKDPKAQNRALTLFGRFTPAGTPFGHVPAQMGIVPTLATGPGQTVFPDPDGRKGLLKKAKNPGQSGDGWTRLANGGTGPWGKYGAAGLMLRHVDQNGEARYLMVQRGPAISDPGKWQFPGGAIDSNETMAEGATREVVEELGFQYSDFTGAGVHGYHEATVTGAGSWKYTSFAATVPTQLKPDLSTYHARQETADAKWMTLDEIRKLDGKGKLLKPLAAGALERNVISLFPSSAGNAGAAGVPGSGPVTKKLPRLSPSAAPAVRPAAPAAPPAPHKPSTGKNLIPDKAAQDKLRADVAAVRKNYRGKVADERLAAIGAMQGFDDVPTVVSKKEMDKLLATGDYIEAWRGVGGNIYKTAAQINEEMRSGPAYYGTGIFGNGYYLSTRRNVAVQYSDHTKNSVIRILIPKTAKIEEHSKVLKKAKQAVSSAGGFSPVGRRNLGGGTLHDEGRYGAAEGLDGIEIPSTAQSAGMGGASHVASPGMPAYNWLNRSVLIIQEADA